MIFRTGGSSGSLIFEDWQTDSSTLAITENNEQLTLFAVQGARSLARGKRRLFASDTAASIAASYTANSIEAALNSKGQMKIELFVGRAPRKVLVDGREAALNYNQTAATITLAVPSGEHRLKIDLR